jgi:hypothetical protein
MVANEFIILGSVTYVWGAEKLVLKLHLYKGARRFFLISQKSNAVAETGKTQV